MLAVIAIIHVTCRHAKRKTLLTGIAFQPVKQAEAVGINQTKEYCTPQTTTVCDCSINNDDNITYCLYLSNQSKMYYI